jgi:hypothetical protein
MFSLSAILIYVVAVVSVALPLYLLYRFRSQAWYWHVLAIIVALVIGLMPGTAVLQTENGSLLYGFWFLLLTIWGAGGLILPIFRLGQRLWTLMVRGIRGLVAYWRLRKKHA